ncbi:hypothetical protein LIA77_07558 [Sarocladium implicatum]|nr:hypothetical protein LIA77_07558 [Sarocladium implicatum]
MEAGPVEWCKKTRHPDRDKQVALWGLSGGPCRPCEEREGKVVGENGWDGRQGGVCRDRPVSVVVRGCGWGEPWDLGCKCRW